MDPLVARQQALQDEAASVLEDLELLPLLRQIGDPVKVGSLALGLMVARDIDLTILCSELDPERVFELVQPLASHSRVHELRFRNDTNHWNLDGDHPDGVYWGPRYRAEAEAEWSLDLWFIHEHSPQVDLEHVVLLPLRLTPETRLAILRIKEDCLGRPWYSSYGIYSAVLDHGVRTPEDYRAHIEGVW